MKCTFCGAESTNYSTYFKNEPICERCFEISVCLSSYYREKYNAEKSEKKEGHVMSALKVEYNGFTGELVKFEREIGIISTTDDGRIYGGNTYSLSIYDSEKRVMHSFSGVKLEDVKFLSGAVSFDG